MITLKKRRKIIVNIVLFLLINLLVFIMVVSENNTDDYVEVNETTLDQSGNIIICGRTTSDNFPVKKGFNHQFNGKQDVFITKFSPKKDIIWSTFLGGSEWDSCRAIALDSQNNIIVTGVTSSADFPATNTLEGSYLVGGGDIFISKFTSDGNLLWSRFLGGSDSEDVSSIIIDSNDTIYLSGETSSADFPTHNQSGVSLTGGQDCFATILSPNGELLSTITLGGSDRDLSYGLRRDNNGDIILVGRTESSDFPIKNAYDPTFDTYNLFLVKMVDNGSLLWSTYFGASTGFSVWDNIAFVIDKQNNIIISGSTRTIGGVPMLNAFQSKNMGNEDIFLSKFSSNGSLVWSTYFGGEGYDYFGDVCLDDENNIFVTGTTSSRNFPILNPYSSKFNGHYDGFISKLTYDGALSWSTFYGGDKYDAGHAIETTSEGDIIVTGIRGIPFFNLNPSKEIFILEISSYGNFVEENRIQNTPLTIFLVILSVTYTLLIILIPQAILLGIFSIIRRIRLRKQDLPVTTYTPIVPITDTSSQRVSKQKSAIISSSKLKEDSPHSSVENLMAQPPFYCQLCAEKHPAGIPRVQCESCGRSLCIDSLSDMTKVGRTKCPMCEGKLSIQ